MSLLARHKHLCLLAALLVVIVIYPPLHDHIGSHVAVNVVRTALFLSAAWVGFADRRVRVAALVLAMPAVVGAWTAFDEPSAPVFVGLHLAAAAFEGFVVVSVVGSVFRQGAVTVDSVGGALCGYLLVGLMFGHAFTALEAVVPGSFAGLGRADGEHRHFLLTYFSLVTLTTVGFGDITPVGGAARSLSMAEAVVGQFYMAVLIAGLIGRWTGQPPAPR